MPTDKTYARKQGPKPCLFCGIARGAEKASVVYADEVCVAFLDHRPLMPGHVLLVPRGHYETLDATPDDVMARLGIRVKRLSAAVMASLGAEGSFIALNNVVSQSVPHVHFHIVPRRKGDGLFARGMIWRRTAYKDDDEQAAIAAKIRAAVTS